MLTDVEDFKLVVEVVLIRVDASMDEQHASHDGSDVVHPLESLESVRGLFRVVSFNPSMRFYN